MARNLYRFYLYIVYIALLIFAAVAVGQLLNTLLTFTPLRGSYNTNPPSSAEVVQSVVFAVVSLVIAGALAGLHYWLIRRDMQNDPAAGGSAIRSFFLNITEALGIVLAVPFFGFVVLGSLASSISSNVVGAAAFALPTLALVVLLELERRRTQVDHGAALAFQRLHFYGTQVLLLIFLASAWLSYIKSFVDALFFASRGAVEVCSDSSYCPRFNPLLLLVTVLWFTAFWVGYGWVVRKDRSPLLRLILHFLSFASGVGFVLTGLYQAFRLIFIVVFHAPPALSEVVGPGATYDFFSPFTLGILVIGVYFVWLRMAAQQGLIERKVLSLTEYTIGAILAAGVFWWGCGNALYYALQAWVPVPQAPSIEDWASTVAFILAGVGYIPLGFYLRHRHAVDATTAAGPRRGFVLALFGGGILALAIGGAVALYAWITSIFGSPIQNWQQVAHGGLASFVVGCILVGIYLWVAISEKLLRGHFRRATPAQVAAPTLPVGAPAPPVPVQPSTIENILDELLMGKLTRDEAATHIRELENTSTRTDS